ncbi:MAG: AMP-dependent synthetase/ligase [Solirubrobacteraceae bacterium]
MSTNIQQTEQYASGGPAPAPPAPNLYTAFLATAARLATDPAVKDPERGVELSWHDLERRSAAVAGGLAHLGIGRGDTVALLHSNRHEMYICDLGAVALGAVPFSVYPTSSAEQIAQQLADAGATVAIAEQAFLERLAAGRASMPALERIVVMDGAGADMSLAELEALGEGFDARVAAKTVGPHDLLTLIYTSGTTGPPKGVQLTHGNLMGLVGSMRRVVPLPDRGARVISWLPAAHIAERGAHYYLPVIHGVSVTICPEPTRVVEFLGRVRPNWFFAVPRIWEKLRAAMEAGMAGLPDGEREPAQEAVAAAVRKVRLEQAGEPVPEDLAAAVRAADERLFAKLRAQLGLDEALAVNVGAAPTSREVLEFFHAVGIPLAELWGLSETCGLVTSNAPGEIRLGTVGRPLPGFDVRIAADGEVLVRGVGVMAGYRNLPEQTAAVLDHEGWLATGDIGELDTEGYLRIVDRKKELIINAAGKNMSPAEIEGKLKAATPLIGHVVAIGDGRPYNVALIVLDPEYAGVWAQGQGIADTSLAALSTDQRLRSAVQQAVDRANERMARPEQIKRFAMLGDDWQPSGEELTPTMKLRRRPIEGRYAREIEAMYA